MRVAACLLISLLFTQPAPGQTPMTVGCLRCEYLQNPLGIQTDRPRLSWVPAATARGQRQTAYRVLAATTPEKLAAGEGDLWDSGKVASNETCQVAYAGKRLSSGQYCHWKVQAWDKGDRPSTWSAPATWTMGLLEASDWKAQWIFDPAHTGVGYTRSDYNGYHSAFANHADAIKWFALDLHAPQQIDAIRLVPAHPFDWQPDTPGFLFPVRFKIEVALQKDWSDARVVVDRTQADVSSPGLDEPIYRFPKVTARFVRLVATKLACRNGKNFGLAMANLHVLSGDKVISFAARPYALDEIATGPWAVMHLTARQRPSGAAHAHVPVALPAAMLRKEFSLGGPIHRATVYVTGLGLYELRLNGRRVGDHLLAPEWTMYDKRLEYQTYDVTDLVQQGKNAVGAMLEEGWYAGPLMIKQPLHDASFRLLLRLDVELADGRTETIVTDPTWQSTEEGPIRKAGIYFGETYDATREMPGWDHADFNCAGWHAVSTAPIAAQPELVAQPNEPIRVVEELHPIKMSEPTPHVYVFDMGQNMVGWCRLKVSGSAGQKVTLRHAEMLNPDGTIYTANLRGAAQTDEYTLRGQGEETFEPHFTYHGFRYVELTGLPSPPGHDAIVGRVFCSAAPEAGQFECSDPLVNRLMKNIFWTQRANMMSVPTDCPQRTERLGWLGDIQAFSQTAVFNMDMAAFLAKCTRDIRDCQTSDGRYPDFAPIATDPERGSPGTPAWSDAGIFLPWRVYENYGDKRLLEEHFDSARRWIDYIDRHNPDHLWRKSLGSSYGDWLNGDTLVLKDYPKGISAVPHDVMATAFYAECTEMVGKMARAIGRAKEAENYGELAADIRRAFRAKYVDADGRITHDTQAGYALAIYFHMLEAADCPKAIEHLLAAIHAYKDHPSTGIQTTHRMMLALSEHGHHDEALRIIGLRTVPSWGFMIDQDATTIWERWDGYVPGRGFQNAGMNSFNHWAIGSVGEWVWRTVAGLNPDETAPGYAHFIVRPRVEGRITWARAHYDSIRGRIAISWKRDGGKLTLDVTVPANTTATIYVPAKDAASVTESGLPAAKAEGVKFVHDEGGAAVFDVVSGQYSFASAP